MTVSIVEHPQFDGEGIPYAAELPEWELTRFRGQVVPLTKNNAMRIMLDKAKSEGHAPEFSRFEPIFAR